MCVGCCKVQRLLQRPEFWTIRKDAKLDVKTAIPVGRDTDC